ncbi:peritrophin-44-like isoform X2 [Penaeus chinensis]|uniref:peritrophin-44-like isoform X2 n=1 Tax=Penaeus chinensis TaxID=139456 RepID=UPI001FB5E161|nr:peritrophin-44-like isoform X2 [Penaeus chinensis]
MRAIGVLFLVTMAGAIAMAEESLRSERSVTPDNHPFSHLCEAQPDKFLCANCKTMVQCVKGQAFTRHCIESHYCSVKAEFGGAVCYPDEPVGCTCTKANDFSVDPYDPQRFFSCKDIGSMPESYKCPDGMEFDEASAQCQNVGDLPPCTVSGVFANPKNCNEYYSCISLRHGWLQKTFLCSSNLMYNQMSGTCEDPCIYQFVCQQEGRYPDLLDKRNYFECYIHAGSLLQVRYQCPEGYMWEILSPGVGKCVEDHGQLDSDTAFGQCVLPDDLCPISVAT